MLVAPYLIGLVATIAARRFEVADVVLFALWFMGYFAFYATSLWLKSKRKPRYLPPVRTYLAIAAALGVIALVIDVSIWSWAVPFAPILVLGLYFAYHRDDRSIAAGITTVAAACLMPAVVYAEGFFELLASPGGPAHGLITIICLICFGYFFGTVLYVKTMIRERGHVGYVVASTLWHAAYAGACVLLGARSDSPVASWVGPALTVFFVLMTARALAMPLLWPMRGRALRAGTLGIGEVFATLTLVGILIGAAV